MSRHVAVEVVVRAVSVWRCELTGAGAEKAVSH
jgi:hypothetical protein